ncbi:DEAD/DEAH box helicase [Pleionea sediminis]|uniref:DEAD/DEAH box helicase n=1 Tax=Pleionea sediminis TaxID=2569479 RepID=UPI001185F12A|nr:DEAD/DEAH box helicase [Pleionea sediminis]
MSFESLKLKPELVSALTDLGYKHPTPIQTQVIPAVLSGKDVIGLAQTGTGKTAAFVLPIVQSLSLLNRPSANSSYCLILVPTRELAIQVWENIKSYSVNVNLIAECVYGGVKINPQMKRLRSGCDFIVATPGRLLDLLDRNAIRFDELKYLVFDEADRMLDLGFSQEIDNVLKCVPRKRQTLLFSATFPNSVKKLSEHLTQKPLIVQVNPENKTARTVKQWIHPVDKKRKTELLHYLIIENRWDKTLVFVKTKKGANQLAYDLKKSGIASNAIHGDKSQNERTKALAQFKNNELQVLVATDVAARGLDIEQLPQVVNYDLPKVAEDYVHRIGRTGRAGQTGQAISLVSADEVELLGKIETLTQQLLKRFEIVGFEPAHNLPKTTLKPIKKKKPHKKKLAKAQAKQNVSQKPVVSNTGRSKPRLSTDKRKKKSKR